MTRGSIAAACLVAAALCAGCAATNQRIVLREILDASASTTIPLEKVAIVTIDASATTRKAWDDVFAARLGARGVQTTTRDGLPGAATLDADVPTVDGGAVIEAARKAGADAILFVQPPVDVAMTPGRGAYRWLDARSGPDPRTDLDTTPASVTEVRLYTFRANSGAWRAMVLVYYPAKGTADAGEVAESVAAGLAKRGFLRAPAR
jgi:hypothetical protein